MFRKPIFWAGFVMASIACGVFAYQYFPRAFPIVSLDIQMDRATALESARSLAKMHGWGPDSARIAASFGVDSDVQYFVELEGGGTEAFREMIRGTLLSPYTWQTRLFREGETNETRVWFTPAGKVYGFFEKLSEETAGPGLPPDSARAIAEGAVRADWLASLDAFDLVEQSDVTRLGGRTDHEFVYERKGASIGEARYRLRLTVSGDKLTGLQHFLKIPEGFTRRFTEMRSANDTIAFGATVAMVVLYLIGGCIIGLFFLLRQRWVLWRKALLWGVFIAFLQFLAGMNQLPLLWMGFDTALSAQGFLLQQIAQNLGMFLLMAGLLTLSFMAAESLTRKAFPNHLQFWKLWSSDVAATRSAAGYTVAGYLLVAIFFAYEVALYFVSTGFLGWWTPSSALFQPDALATWFPWLGSIALSAQAGFWEECLFRAVPIAGAALIGERYGGRRWWILGAFVLQAVVFGAGHANYPAQPAYARLVELILPSFLFGLIYIRFGLLCAIVLHYVFDVVWFAMPLFVAEIPGIWIDRGLVIVLTLVPVLVVFGSRLRRGSWLEAADEQKNLSWQPPRVLKKELVQQPVSSSSMHPLTLRVVAAAGLAGVLTWFAIADFSSDVPPLTADRQTAIDLANAQLGSRGIELGPEWKTMAVVEAPLNMNDNFVWRTSGDSAYHDLIGSYLGPPQWKIRYAKFSGDVAERAEEFAVYVSRDGVVQRFWHQLPEARPGDSLEVDAARALADATVQTTFGLDPGLLKRVSSDPSKLPSRRDWLFVYADTQRTDLAQGELRIRVAIAGSQVVDAMQFVHMPEEWQREERRERNLPGILEIVCNILMAVLVIAGAVGAIVSWSRKLFVPRTFVVMLAGFLAISFIDIVNNWPSIEANMITAQPWRNQMIIFASATVLIALVLAATVALIAGMVHHWHKKSNPVGGPSSLLLGLALGGVAAGLASAAGLIPEQLSPAWPDFSSAGKRIPLLGAALGPLDGFLLRTTTILMIFGGVHHFTRGWQQRQPILAAALILVGFVSVGSGGISSIGLWLAEGIATGLLLLLAYVYVLRYQLAAIPVAVATLAVLSQVQQGGYQAYPAALPGAVIAAVLILAVGIWWSRLWERSVSDPDGPAAAPAKK